MGLLRAIVVTSRQVLAGAEVVLAARLYSGVVQLVDRSDKAEDDAVAVHFSDLVELAPELARFRVLPVGRLHVRTPDGWREWGFTSDDDFDQLLSSLG